MERSVMKSKLIHLLCFCRGKNRLFFGFCPMCNSDAPEIYDCPTCNYYSSASGDKYPPTKETKAAWWKTYKGAIDAKLMVSQMVAQSRKT